MAGKVFGSLQDKAKQKEWCTNTFHLLFAMIIYDYRIFGRYLTRMTVEIRTNTYNGLDTHIAMSIGARFLLFSMFRILFTFLRMVNSQQYKQSNILFLSYVY